MRLLNLAENSVRFELAPRPLLPSSPCSSESATQFDFSLKVDISGNKTFLSLLLSSLLPISQGCLGYLNSFPFGLFGQSL
jgi:hypothetical protein